MHPDPAYRYPPDDVLGLVDVRGSFVVTLAALAVGGAVVDVVFFGLLPGGGIGFGDTSIPYNYPFYFDILLLCCAAVFLRLSHGVLWNVAQELVQVIWQNRNDPLSLSSGLDPEAAWTELENALYLAYHPAVIVAGGLAGGLFVISIMAALGVFEAYPYVVMNFGFGAAHGVFFGPVIGGLYILERSYDAYIIDINLLDPDGIGGYRQMGDGIIKLATYGIVVITIDFVILSSVGFTRYTGFQIVVSLIYLLTLVGFVVGTVLVTMLIRRKLLAIRDEKVAMMQTIFVTAENNFWRKLHADENNLSEAVNILSMYAIFHQMSNMNMWPINLYSLSRLAITAGFSLLVYYVENQANIQTILEGLLL